MTGTARNTLILEFKASMSRLERDNPITPGVTAVRWRLGVPARRSPQNKLLTDDARQHKQPSEITSNSDPN